MQAIETTGKIDDKGHIQLDEPVSVKDRNVKIIILMPDKDDLEEKLWLKSLSSNPAFDFLNDEEENIYSLNDGQPFNA